MEAAPQKKSEWVQIAAMVLVVVAIGAAIGLGSTGIYQLATGVPVFSIASSTTGGSTLTVSLPNGVGNSQGLNFAPTSVNVAKGGTVKWTNNDPVPHTVTSTSVPSGASSFDSGNMNGNATYTVTFNIDGTYQYKCSYHPWMHGTVIVTG